LTLSKSSADSFSSRAIAKKRILRRDESDPKVYGSSCFHRLSHQFELSSSSQWLHVHLVQLPHQKQGKHENSYPYQLKLDIEEANRKR